ncbi:TAFII55 protein conserved region-domain-containing protein [Phyllosticta citrichinensis]|uniref:TAFII55 protein conserved region-domain-containing protein n=1 Tax=Phyllosticta citrichinensis TaxID=1130410 RepID=A0ABR1XRW4_9PEZI
MSSPNNPRPTIMKLKLNSGSKTGAAGASDAAAPSPSVQTPSVQTPGGSNKIKIKWGGQSAQNTPASENPPPALAPQPAASQPPAKPKRKYTKKADKGKAAGEGAAAAVKPTSPKASRKRKNEGTEDGATALVKKSKPSLALKTAFSPAAAANTKMSLKIRNMQPKTPTVTRLKVKHAGKPPPRLPGYGYDSEDDEAEEDPSIEHAFILRMMPGPDCDYLAKAISEKKVGVSLKEGGADVSFRFLDRDGRRACVTIKGNHYAASLLDLPCVVEGMKSWERKGAWFKTTDICQLLLVWARVDKEEEARTRPLPKEIDDKTWQYPHGLTPPMHYVRKRRFRPRVARHVIDAVEEELERLLTADKQAKEAGGESVYELVDPNKPDEPDDDGAFDELLAQQAQSAVDEEGSFLDAEGEDVDEDALTAMMEQQLEAEDEPMASVEAPPTANDIDAAHVVAAQALGGDLEVGTPTGAEGETPGASAAGGDTEQEATSGSDADDDDDDEIDEVALAAQEEKAQLREEVADLKREVDNAKQQMERQNNPLLKQRLMAKVKSLQSDLELKKASLGDDDDE